MEDLMLTGGSTPFEIAAANREIAHKQLTVMYATDELVRLIAECDVMLQAYQDELTRWECYGGSFDEEVRMLAAEATKDKRAAEAALEQLMKSAEELGFCD